MDHFFVSDDLRSAAVATSASRSAGGVDARGLYQALARTLAGSGGSVLLHVEGRSFDPAPDEAPEMRPGEIDGVDVELIPADESDLLQLGDLLTGSVRGDSARGSKGRSNPRGSVPGGSLKDRLVASLERRPNVQRPAHPTRAKRGDGFNVEVLRPPF